MGLPCTASFTPHCAPTYLPAGLTPRWGTAPTWGARGVEQWAVVVPQCPLQGSGGVCARPAPPSGNSIGLAQFRDNVLATVSGPSCKEEMQRVCDCLTDAWSLLVICPCITETQTVCTRQCLSTQCTAMGLHIAVTPSSVTVRSQPSGLDESWRLKYYAPLQSFRAVLWEIFFLFC